MNSEKKPVRNITSAGKRESVADKKIFIGSDHAGFEMKEKLKLFLAKLGYEVIDKGAFRFEPEDDYPDFSAEVAREVAKDAQNNANVRGIILGGSGQGEAIVANRFPKVRAVVFNGQYKPTNGREAPDEIVISREHNDSNILALGARFLTDEEAETAVKKWLETAFSGEKRHLRRIVKIDNCRT